MAGKLATLKDFIYGNLPYLLLAILALALLLTEREIGFGITSRLMNSSEGLVPGLAAQRVIAVLALTFALRKIWLGTRR